MLLDVIVVVCLRAVLTFEFELAELFHVKGPHSLLYESHAALRCRTLEVLVVAVANVAAPAEVTATVVLSYRFNCYP